MGSNLVELTGTFTEFVGEGIACDDANEVAIAAGAGFCVTCDLGVGATVVGNGVEVGTYEFADWKIGIRACCKGTTNAAARKHKPIANKVATMNTAEIPNLGLF